jgi:hypothetical protein
MSSDSSMAARRKLKSMRSRWFMGLCNWLCCTAVLGILAIVFFSNYYILFVTTIPVIILYMVVSGPPPSVPHDNFHITAEPQKAYSGSIGTKYCPHCGTETDAGEVYCPQCRRRV